MPFAAAFHLDDDFLDLKLLGDVFQALFLDFGTFGAPVPSKGFKLVDALVLGRDFCGSLVLFVPPEAGENFLLVFGELVDADGFVDGFGFDASDVFGEGVHIDSF